MNANNGPRTPPMRNGQSFHPNENYQSYKNQSLYDEDEDMKSTYLAKEMAMKRINEELERKSSEIFSKLEKMRTHQGTNSENNSSYGEVGQGDGPHSDHGSYNYAVPNRREYAKEDASHPDKESYNYSVPNRGGYAKEEASHSDNGSYNYSVPNRREYAKEEASHSDRGSYSYSFADRDRSDYGESRSGCSPEVTRTPTRSTIEQSFSRSARYQTRPVSNSYESVQYLNSREAKAEDNSGGESYFRMTRPATSAAISSSPCTSMDEFFSSKPSTGCYSIRRAETAKPFDSVDEKQQLRLQKATESVLKCVQSKMVNYESRMADMHLQYRQKIQENTMLESKVKALEEDRKKLMKTVQSLQATTDRFSKSAENCKMNLNLKAQAFGSLKKDMDGLKRDIKQKNGLIQSLQTRLDRVTEENRRLKSQHQSTQLNMKQQQTEDRTTMEELKSRVAQLEHQKATFQATVEKQTQLIRSLRTQKVSLTNIIRKHKIKTDDDEFSDYSGESGDVENDNNNYDQK